MKKTRRKYRDLEGKEGEVLEEGLEEEGEVWEGLEEAQAVGNSRGTAGEKGPAL